MQKEYFKNLHGKSPKFKNEHMKIINNQKDIKLEVLDIIQTKIKNRKAASLDEISPEVSKTRKFDDLLL